jgi:hypothetical protein
MSESHAIDGSPPPTTRVLLSPTLEQQRVTRSEHRQMSPLLSNNKVTGVYEHN